MNDIAALLAILAALTVGVVSPGPSFVMVARTAIASGRAQGIAASLGMGAGGALFAIAALLGLQAVLLAVPALYAALKLLGGLYLAWLGWRIWRAARLPLAFDSEGQASAAGRKRALMLGFTTQVSNPKTAVVYASVFAAFLPVAHSAAFNVALVCAVFVVEAAWYALVALALSSDRPRHAYLGCKAWLDRLAGGVMFALGLRLVWSARH